MSEINRIVDQLKRSYMGEAWHGPSLMELLNEVDFEMASTHKLNNVHNIWEILLHISAWIKFTRKTLDDEPLPTRLDETEDWPPISNVNSKNWEDSVKSFQNENELLLKKLSKIDDSKLSDIVPGRNYSYYFLLHGVVQHNLYHAGQISLIKSSIIRSGFKR